jgi:hypothetical protein
MTQNAQKGMADGGANSPDLLTDDPARNETVVAEAWLIFLEFSPNTRNG